MILTVFFDIFGIILHYHHITGRLLFPLLLFLILYRVLVIYIPFPHIFVTRYDMKTMCIFSLSSFFSLLLFFSGPDAHCQPGESKASPSHAVKGFPSDVHHLVFIASASSSFFKRVGFSFSSISVVAPHELCEPHMVHAMMLNLKVLIHLLCRSPLA